MYHLKFFIVALTIFKISTSLPVESTDETVKPVDLAYDCVSAQLEEEDGERKTPILLIHGLGGSRWIWYRLTLVLATRTKRRVCAVDLRNHGDSPWNNRTDVEALAADIGHFLDTHGIKKVNILGQSLGGKTAIHFTLKNPDRVASLIAEDISPNSLPKEALQYEASMLQFLTAGLESIPEGLSLEEAKYHIVSFINQKLHEMGYTEIFPSDYARNFGLKLVDGKWRFKFNIDVLEQSLKDVSSVWTPSTGKYEGPSLFIYGTKSPFKVYEAKENILQLFPNVQFLPMEDAGHLILGTYPEFDSAVIEFLEKLDQFI